MEITCCAPCTYMLQDQAGARQIKVMLINQELIW